MGKKIIHLYYNEGLTQNEIGQTLGISENTVAVTHRNALKKLREKLRNFKE